MSQTKGFSTHAWEREEVAVAIPVLGVCAGTPAVGMLRRVPGEFGARSDAASSWKKKDVEGGRASE